MLILMYMAAVISVLIIIPLFKAQVTRLNRKKCDSNYRYRRMWGLAFVDLTIFCVLFIFFGFALPSLEWHLGKKDYQPEDLILSETDIKPISSSSNTIYVRETYDSDNNKKYIVNIGGALQEYDNKSTTIDENNIYKNNVSIKDIDEYKVYELKGHNIIVNSINDMYANVYVNKTQKTHIRKKTQICVPKNSIEKSK